MFLTLIPQEGNGKLTRVCVFKGEQMELHVSRWRLLLVCCVVLCVCSSPQRAGSALMDARSREHPDLDGLALRRTSLRSILNRIHVELQSDPLRASPLRLKDGELEWSRFFFILHFRG